MTYTVESFSWGIELIDPKIQKIKVATIDEAKKTMEQQWENPKCFHVRVLSPIDPTDPLELKHRLHCMKSRPTTDRELHQFFETIIVPEDIRKPRHLGQMNVLRVSDFRSAIPVKRIYFSEIEILHIVWGTSCMDQIETEGSSGGSEGSRHDNLETCIATAALTPNDIANLLGFSDDCRFYLSEVDIKGVSAELSFSTMDASTDFIQ